MFVAGQWIDVPPSNTGRCRVTLAKQPEAIGAGQSTETMNLATLSTQRVARSSPQLRLGKRPVIRTVAFMERGRMAYGLTAPVPYSTTSARALRLRRGLRACAGRRGLQRLGGRPLTGRRDQ
jgi:hypothetical protein